MVARLLGHDSVAVLGLNPLMDSSMAQASETKSYDQAMPQNDQD